MLFNSVEFLFFFPVVVLLAFIMPNKFRWALLLVASYIFYMAWEPWYVFLIVFSTIIDYLIALKLGKVKKEISRKLLLTISLATNLGLLGFFKYYNFFAENTEVFFANLGFATNLKITGILLPVGISFYTFQTLSYSIDVYRKKIEPEKHFGKFALFVSFFPQLVAGPIERASHFLPQLQNKIKFSSENVISGLKLMLWGFFQKVVIADNLASVANEVYTNSEKYDALTVLFGTYFFSFQIYCDFCGYSLIAIGAAKILGYDLMENFRTPYLSKSIKEFWSRWHISLSTWFKDYLYIPLGGNKAGRNRWLANLFIVFLVSGLWHGANWTFVVWGALHGTYLLVSVLLHPLLLKVENYFVENHLIKYYNLVKIIFIFHLVFFAWIFFRANSISEAFLIVNKVLSWNKYNFTSFGNFMVTQGGGKLFFKMFLLGLFVFSDGFMNRFIKKKQEIRSSSMRLAIYALITALIVLFGFWGEVEFIYFQF